MLTNLIFLNKLRHVLLILCHKLNISTYVDNIDLKENNNFVKKCIEKSYFCKNVTHVFIILFHNFNYIMQLK